MDTGKGFGPGGEGDSGGDSAESPDSAVSFPDAESVETPAIPSNASSDISTDGPADVQGNSPVNAFGPDECRAGDYGYGEPDHPDAPDADLAPDDPRVSDAAADVPDGGLDGADAVTQALASIRSIVQDLASMPLWSRSDAASCVSVREAFAVKQSIEAMWLGLVADLDTRPEAIPKARAGMTAHTFLRTCLNRTAPQAAADVKAAKALGVEADPAGYGMPSMGAALREGTISREHVDVAIRAMRKIPKDLLTQPLPADTPAAADGDRTDDSEPATNPSGDQPTGATVPAGEAVDAFFAEHSQTLDPVQTGRLARGLLAVLDPDGHDGFDPQATERRSVTHSTDSNGMVVGRFQLDPAGGAWFRAAIEHFSASNPDAAEPVHDTGIEDTGTHNPGAEGTGTSAEVAGGTSTDGSHGGDGGDGGDDEDVHTTVVRDQRTAGQRNADALVLMARLSLGAVEAGTEKSGEPPRITITTGLDDLRNATGTPTAAPDTDTDTDTHTDTDADSDGDAADIAYVAEFDAAQTTEASRSDSADPSTAQPSTAQPSTAQSSSGQPSSGQSSSGRSNTGRSTARGPVGAAGSPVGAFATYGRAAGRGAYCQQTGPLSPRLLGRLACDSVLQKALLSSSGTVLDLGRDTRTITRAQRRALNVRDRGCVVPGCVAPPQWCEGHHVKWWSKGGPTDLNNLALVCGRHHTEIHQGVWDLVMINGVAWARPPDWIDIQRRLIRNTLHQQTDAAHSLGTQLRLALPEEPPYPYPWLKPPGGKSPHDPSPPEADTG